MTLAPPGRGHGSGGTGPSRPFRGSGGTARTWAGTATGQFGRTVSFAFPLEPEFQACVAPVALGVLCHDGNGLLPAHDDQKFSGPGNGGVENAAAEQVRGAVPGREDHGPVL